MFDLKNTSKELFYNLTFVILLQNSYNLINQYVKKIHRVISQ